MLKTIINNKKEIFYTFKVPIFFSKNEIRKYIYKRYKVTLYKINTIIYYSKKINKKTNKGIFKGRLKKRKKVIIKLKRISYLKKEKICQ
ncbi:putative 50S ribosomal subunit protein L23 [Candidatus Karelsulcia muelleri CARI]|uniref:50S ribosomal protein L23 n=1 Tax=Karelsulcia muelleri (strain CARI) TaxID=706194 RepID=E0TJR2_KARMC|nr:putative 50S ribosomal subunit protein L23 [Candidatus Karelsulcia muelleri CARI]